MRRVLEDALTLFRREWLRYRRDRSYWIGQLAFPLLVVGFIGFGLDRVVELPTGASYVSHIASGILALLIGSGAVGAGFTLIQDRESGFLRVLLVAPVSRTSLVLGKIAARIVVSTLLVTLLVLGLASFTPLRLLHPAAALLAVVGVTTAFASLGIALASFLRSPESFRFLAALVTVPLYLLSGIFYPISTLPGPTRLASQLNPLTYGVDLFRYGLLGIHELPLGRSATLLAVLCVAGTLLSILALDRRSRG